MGHISPDWTDETVKLRSQTEPYYILTGTNDDCGGLVVDGHGPVVGGDREPAAHLVEAPVHHGSVVGINLDSFFPTLSIFMQFWRWKYDVGHSVQNILRTELRTI